ncbi:30S ribosomal protein S17 [Kallipyga massiliensis]|uniref:30S ribosomal protein S17 n=1 Tax=Kallipyga massiliensis TaxID=1472764 RepID=UPI0004BC5193|nr:30S ribosomal protein S17 [Kallipyga massiliensis]
MERTTNRKTISGVVVSDKMDKTIVVEVSQLVKHPKYKKMLTRSKRFKAHDEENAAKVGDKVLLMETRPLSKQKRFRLVEILEAAK